jgi:enoyl-CoA hydratase/carnithine racemase
MPETYETLLLEKRERVAIITINRPDREMRSTSRLAKKARRYWKNFVRTVQLE